MHRNAAIGIDYTPAYEQGAGIGRYVRELVSALAQVDQHRAYRLFVSGAKQQNLSPIPGLNFSWAVSRISPLWAARIWHRARIPIPVELWTGKLSIFHATDFALPPTLPGTKTLLTVHDLSFVFAPETASPRLKRYLDQIVPRSIRRADHVLADSLATKQDIVEVYGTVPEKITVLYSGVNPDFRQITDPDALNSVRQKYGLGNWPYLFTVGTVQPRKNYARLCEAIAQLKEFSDVHLVIAGGKGWLDDNIYSTVERLQLKQRVHFIGFAADEDLPALYSAAVAVPYVSLYEGFGLPVLEAMACGAPVVAANCSSLPEVVGMAGVMVDPYDTDAIADGIRQVLDSSDFRAELQRRGSERARQFTWQRSAQELARVYGELLSETVSV